MESLRLAGELSLAAGRDDAAGHFEAALELARDQGARAFELRVLVSLAALAGGRVDADRRQQIETLCRELDPENQEPDVQAGFAFLNNPQR